MMARISVLISQKKSISVSALVVHSYAGGCRAPVRPTQTSKGINDAPHRGLLRLSTIATSRSPAGRSSLDLHRLIHMAPYDWLNRRRREEASKEISGGHQPNPILFTSQPHLAFSPPLTPPSSPPGVPMPPAAPSPAPPPFSLRAASSCLPSFSAAARRKQQAAASSSLMEVFGQSQCGEGRLLWVWDVAAGAPTAAAVGRQRGLSWLEDLRPRLPQLPFGRHG
jgi:hypothetical protein